MALERLDRLDPVRVPLLETSAYLYVSHCELAYWFVHDSDGTMIGKHIFSLFDYYV